MKMYQPFVFITTCVVLLSDAHLVFGESVDQLYGAIYHSVPVIQEKTVENLPILSKRAVVPSEISYTNVLGFQTSYARSLYYTERDIANGYASQVHSSSVAFTVPENLEHFAPKETTVQSVSLLNYVVPVTYRYATVAKSIPVGYDYDVDLTSRISRILTGSHVDNSYNSNVFPSDPADTLTETVKKAPLYTEAIFKPWPPLNK